MSILLFPCMHLHLVGFHHSSPNFRSGTLGLKLGHDFKQLEHDVETVVKVLQPGPLGIIEHKFTDEEIKSANAAVNRAVDNWRRIAYHERNDPTMKDFIDVKTFTFQNTR